jgi:plastin-1
VSINKQVKTVSEGAAMLDDDHGDSREERAFRMWINSLGLDGLYIDRLFDDCTDGLHLLKVLDFLQPGCVPWNKVEKKPNIKVKKVSNCNLALDIGKSMKFSLVGIGGSDIVDGNKKLLLALVWQMMRQHTIQMLNSLKQGGKAVTEQDMVDWFVFNLF